MYNQMTNRSFSGSYPQKTPVPQPPIPKPQQPFVISSHQRKDANKLLGELCEQYNCGLTKLLRVVEQEVAGEVLPRYVFEALVERLESKRRRHELSHQEIADLERAKSSPVRQAR